MVLTIKKVLGTTQIVDIPLFLDNKNTIVKATVIGKMRTKFEVAFTFIQNTLLAKAL